MEHEPSMPLFSGAADLHAKAQLSTEGPLQLFHMCRRRRGLDFGGGGPCLALDQSLEIAHRKALRHGQFSQPLLFGGVGYAAQELGMSQREPALTDQTL